MSLEIPMFPLWRVSFREAASEPVEISEDERHSTRESRIYTKALTEHEVSEALDAREQRRLRRAF